MGLTGLSFRKLKEIITILRDTHPICSTELNGGGYWLANDNSEIMSFIRMIERRRKGYDNTIRTMSTHIFNNLE
jgi:hypothetical protein